jgi:hypothetical protein
MRHLGNLWQQETERWRELMRKWDFDTQNAMVFGQEAVNSRRGNRIIAAFLSVKDGQVEVTVRKSALPMEDQGSDLLAVC